MLMHGQRVTDSRSQWSRFLPAPYVRLGDQPPVAHTDLPTNLIKLRQVGAEDSFDFSIVLGMLAEYEPDHTTSNASPPATSLNLPAFFFLAMALKHHPTPPCHLSQHIDSYDPLDS